MDRFNYLLCGFFLLLGACNEGPALSKNTLGAPMGAKFPALVLENVTPPEGAYKVSIRPQIILRFNNRVDVTSLKVITNTSICAGSVQLSSDDFFTCEKLITPISEDGGFSYSIWAAKNLEILTNYKIKITDEVKDTIGKKLTNPYLSKIGFISEDNIRPEVESTIPASGIFEVDEKTPISVTFSKAMNPNTITTNIGTSLCSGNFQLSSNGFVTCVPMALPPFPSIDLRTFTVNPLWPLKSETFYQIRVLLNVEDLAGNSLLTQYLGQGFKIKDWIPPFITNTFPQNSAIEVPFDTPILISFSEVMDEKTINVNTSDNDCSGSIQLSKNDFLTCVQFVANVTSTNGMTFNARPLNDLIQGSLYEIKVTQEAEDLAGNGLEEDAFTSFSTVALPLVLSISPFPGEKNIPYEATITVIFNKSMDPSSIFSDPNSTSCNVGTFVVVKSDGVCIPLQIVVPSNGNRTFSTKAIKPFDDQAILKVKISKEVRDPLGFSPDSDFIQDPPWQIIDTTPPEVISSIPDKNETNVLVTSQIVLNFSEKMDESSLSGVQIISGSCEGPIQLSFDDFSSCVAFDSSKPISNPELTQFELTPFEILDTNTYYKIKVTTTAQDANLNNLIQEHLVSFKTVLDLKVSDTVPADSLTPLIPRDTDVLITFNRAMEPESITAQATSTICSGTIQVSNDNFSTCIGFNDPLPNEDATIWTLDPIVNLENFTIYKIKVLEAVEDIYGSNLKNDFIQSNGFKTEDTIAPTISSTLPDDGEILIDRNTDITVLFDEPMDPLSITTNATDTDCLGTIQVSNDDFSTCAKMNDQPIGDPMGISWAVTPANTLENFSTYKIRVSIGAKDQQGNNLENPFTQPIGFTTIDDIPPLVIATIPASGTTEVPVDSQITIEFSEEMDGSTIGAGNDGNCGTASIEVQIGPTFSSCLRIGSVTPATNATTFTLFPLDDLGKNGTIYKIVVNNDAKDVQGNPLGSNFSSTFRSLDEIPPSVKSFSPLKDSIKQNINTELSVSFSEDIDTSTLIINAPGDASCTGKSWYASTDGGTTCVEMNPYTTDDGLNITFRMLPIKFWPRASTITVSFDEAISDPVGATLTNPESYSFTTSDPGQASMTTPPNMGTDVQLETMIQISWDRLMDINSMTLNNLDSKCLGDIQVSKDNFATTTNCVEMSSNLPTDLGGGVYQLDPQVDNLEPNITFTVRVTPSVLNSATPTGAGWPINQDFQFVTTVPPIVAGIDPLDGFLMVPRNATITVTFSKAMDPLSITTNATDTDCVGSFQVSSDPGFATATCVQMSSGPVEVTSKSYSIKALSKLLNQTQYFVKLTTGAQDILGQEILNDFVSNFTTIDDTPPTLLSSTPSATNTIPTTGVSASFSEPMDTSTFTTTPITIACDSSITLQVSADSFITCLGTSSPVFSGSDDTVFATPTNYLPNSSAIEARVLTNVTDLAGNQLGTDTSWSFVTGMAPLVASINPIDGAKYLPESTIIQLDFNKAIDQSLLIADNDFTCTSGNVHISLDENFTNCLDLTIIGWASPTQATLTVNGGVFQPETQYFFRIDRSGVKDLEWNLQTEFPFNSNFTIRSTTPPELELPTIPANGATDIGENQFVQISFDKDMDGTTITSNNGTIICAGTVQVSLDDFSTCHPLNAPIPTSNTDVYTIPLSSSYISSASYKLKILGLPSAPTATADPSGNYLSDDYLQDTGFTVKNYTIPYVVNTNPVSPTNTNPLFTVEFSEEMEPNTLSTLTGLLTAPCPATNSVGFLLAEDEDFTTCVPMISTLGQTTDDVTYNFTLASGLKNNFTYWYLVSSYTMDKGGNNVATPTVVSFMVNEPLDNYPSIVSPPDKATNVSYDTSSFAFELDFDKEVDPSKVTNNSSGSGCIGNILLSRQEDDFSQCVQWATAPTSASATQFNLGTLESFLEQNTTYILKVSKDIENVAGTPKLRNDYYFSFSTGGAPSVINMQPQDGEIDFSVNGDLIVTFDKKMDVNSITGGTGTACSGSIDVSLNSYSTCMELDVLDLDGGYTFRLAPKVLFSKTQTYRWRINSKALDISGYPLQDYYPDSIGQSFTIGNFLSVIFNNPEDEETGVSNNPPISIIFSEKMTTNTVDTNNGNSNCEGSIRLSDDLGIGCLPLTIVTNEDEIFFNTGPVNNLALSNFTVTVTTKVAALSGAILKEDFLYRFSTGTPPDVVSHTPASDATGVSSSTNIKVDFSKIMDISTVTTNNGENICEGTIQLKAQGSSECVPLANPTNSGNISFTINLIAALDSAQIYEVLVSTGVKSSGLPMFNSYKWSFTTANALANFEKNQNQFYGKGIRCTPLMESKLLVGKKVKVSWKQNRESLVNSLGGGYEVFYKKGNDLFCRKIPYLNGEWAPNDINLNLSPGRWFIRVKAYSRFNKAGSAFSKIITLDVP